MRTMSVVLGLFAATAAAQPAATGPVVRLDGYQVVRVEIDSAADIETMLGFGADQWSHHVPAGGSADFMIAPEMLDALDVSGLVYEVINDNVQAAIDAENARLRGGGEGGGARGWFDDFKRLNEINDYMDVLAAGNPGIAEIINVGTSIQGRPIRGLRIANDTSGEAACKPSVLFNSMQHAREWISPMVAMYTADQLLAGYGVDQNITDLIDRTEILIVPVVNPDGYEYTWTTYRYWRKNRRNNGSGSYGVDLNRNWGYAWGNNNGSSGDKWSEVYRGTAPFSEPELHGLRDWSNSRPRMAAQVDLHSYGQWILWPWGYTSAQPPYAQTFTSLGNEIKQVIKSVHNRNYTAGQANTLLYPVSGGCLDWYLGGVDTINYTLELRGSDFVIPPNQIIPNGEEIFPALVHFAEWAVANRGAAGDFNMDARIDTLDVLTFLNAWNNNDPRGDFNSDGVFNTQDVLAFLNAWNLGC